MSDLILLHQESDTLGQAFHSIIFLRHHGFQIEIELAGLDAHTCKIILGRIEQLGCVQQRFGGDATDIQAGAAQRVTHFNNCCF